MLVSVDDNTGEDTNFSVSAIFGNFNVETFSVNTNVSLVCVPNDLDALLMFTCTDTDLFTFLELSVRGALIVLFWFVLSYKIIGGGFVSLLTTFGIEDKEPSEKINIVVVKTSWKELY